MNLTERLNAIWPKITSEDFLKGRGLGNEIPFYVFDYPPEEELAVRQHIEFLLNRLSQHHPELKVLHIKLFHFMVEYLQERGNLEKAFALEANKGEKALWKALSASVKPELFIKSLDAKHCLAEQGIIFISGVGTIWPWIRAHSLLNNLQSVTDKASVVLFYPGVYSGSSLRLFDILPADNYYRAFRFIT